MDQLYFEDGYYEGKYFVYTADIVVGFTPYILADYLDQGFFEDRGSAFTLTGSLTRQTYQEFTADFVSAFTLTGVVGRRQSAAASLTSAITVTAAVVKTARAQTALTSAVTAATTSQKTARSSVTLTSIANVSAQAARFRGITSSVSAAATATTTATKSTQTSPALTSAFSQSSQAQRFRSTPATLSSAVTQTTSTIKTARAVIALTSAFAPVIVANASVSNGSNFTSNFTVTALTGVTRQFPGNYITGAGLDIPEIQYPKILDFDQTQFSEVSQFNIREQAWTFSIWVKRYSRSGVDETIVATTIQPTTNSGGGITFKNSNIRIRFGADLNVIDTQWVNVAPNDTNWHHYLFRADDSITDLNNPQLVRRWVLWVDGVYKGASSTHNTNLNNYPSEFNWCGRFSSNPEVVIGGLLLGYETFYAESGETEYPNLATRPLDGAFAQLWMGRVSASEFRVERFYSGLRDLGATGTATGLPTPIFYNKLTTPYTGVTWENGGSNIASTEFLTRPSAEAIFSISGEASTVIVTTASLSSAFTQSSTAFRILRLQSAQSAQATVTATIAKRVGITAAITATATQTAINQRIRYGTASISSQATVTATAYKVKPYAAALSAQATVSATPNNRTRSQSAALSAQFTVTARPTDRTRDAVSLEAGAFTLSAAGLVIRAVGSNMTAAFTQTAAAKKVIVVAAALSAQFTIQPIVVYRVIIGQATLSVTGFVLTQGDILNFAPELQIVVPPESRLWYVIPESRHWAVDEETRSRRVLPESRELTIEQEDLVNII
jgi:hypothetical protein